MFMHYCGQKGSKFGELKNSLKQQQKCLEVEKTMLKIKMFLGGHAPKPPYIRAAASPRAGHVFDMCRVTIIGGLHEDNMQVRK